MANNFGSLSPRLRGNIFLAGVALSIGLLAYNKLIHGRQSPYNRCRRWWKPINKDKHAAEPRQRRYNAYDEPANWTLVQVPVNVHDSKPRRKRRKKRRELKYANVTGPIQIYVTDEPGIDEAALAEEANRRRRSAWERWF